MMMVESQIPELIGPESSPGFLPSAKLTPVTRLPLSIPDMYLNRKTGRCSPRMITIPPRADPYVDIVSRAWKANPTLGPPVSQDVVPIGASAAACQLPAFAHEGHPFQGLCSMAALSTRAVETCARALAPATQPLGFSVFGPRLLIATCRPRENAARPGQQAQHHLVGALRPRIGPMHWGGAQQ